MESVTAAELGVDPARKIPSAPIRSEVEAFQQAWRLPQTMQAELLAEVIRCLPSCVPADSRIDEDAIAICLAEKLLRSRLNTIFAGELDEGDGPLSPDQRFAILCSGWPEKGRGLQEAARALHPQRPLDAHLPAMETSLARLPSFRMIAGWCLLMLGLAAGFMVTH